MVISGKKCKMQADRKTVAAMTLATLKRLRAGRAVPGIAFLSGGQSDEDATAHLDEMNKLGGGPWMLSFSYGRALQAAALKAWGGRKENFAAGQRRLPAPREDERPRCAWKVGAEAGEGGVNPAPA